MGSTTGSAATPTAWSWLTDRPRPDPRWRRSTPAADHAGGRDKLDELLAAGTRWVWVARLVDPRRVEIHEAGQPLRTGRAEGELAALREAIAAVCSVLDLLLTAERAAELASLDAAGLRDRLTRLRDRRRWD